jgi:hypothetical protein
MLVPFDGKIDGDEQMQFGKRKNSSYFNILAEYNRFPLKTIIPFSSVWERGDDSHRQHAHPGRDPRISHLSRGNSLATIRWWAGE